MYGLGLGVLGLESLVSRAGSQFQKLLEAIAVFILASAG